jgi:hypothetical protein
VSGIDKDQASLEKAHSSLMRIGFPSFLVSIERQESKLGKAEENLDFETQGERNG